MDWEKVIPLAIPMKRAKMITRDPYHCMPAIYTSNILAESKSTSQKFREKIAADLKKAGIR